MKILILSGAFPPDKCGVGDYTSKLYDALLKTKVDGDIYLLSSHELLKNGKRVSLRPKPLLWNFFEVKQIIREIKQINPDIINLQFPTARYRMSVSILFLVFFLKQLGFRIVTTLHEYSFSPKLAQLRTNFIIMSSDKLIVVDEKYKSDIANRKLCESKSILYIPIGSNIERSELDAAGIQKVRGQYLTTKGLLIGYFGFIFPAKGIESFIKLGKSLKQQNRNFKIVIAAELNSKNSYHQQLKKLIQMSNLDEDLVVTGYLPANKIADILKSMDVVIFPFTHGISTKNGSVLAALNQGVNVISTKSDRVQDSPYRQLHLIDHYMNSEQIVDIINNHLVFNNSEDVITWDEIGKSTIDFLVTGVKK